MQPDLKFNQVGKPLIRRNSLGKIMGLTPYAGDCVMPGMLHAKVLRADIVCARLKRLDVSKARAAGRGLRADAEDMPERTIATDIPGQTGRTKLKADRQILVKERVRHFGEPETLIAAETA